MRRQRLTGLLTAAAACAALAAAASAAAQPAQPATQLTGTFQMTGRVTAARFVRGEHMGEVVRRTWTFTPLCSSGPCGTVRLVRTRATGTDTLLLHAIGPHAYAGRDRFYAPLRCAGRIYRPGQAILFRIRVHVTATAAAPGGGTTASAITAAYRNTSRLNLTPCLALLGHDAARYTGTLATG